MMWLTDGRTDGQTDGRHTIIRPKFYFGRIKIAMAYTIYKEMLLVSLWPLFHKNLPHD